MKERKEIIKSTEFDLYEVVEKDNPATGAEGHGIYLSYDSANPDKKELIFGLDKKNDGTNKAFLDYWCLRLNRAFVQGWCYAKGYNVNYPSEGYFKSLNELVEVWTKQKNEMNEVFIGLDIIFLTEKLSVKMNREKENQGAKIAY